MTALSNGDAQALVDSALEGNRAAVETLVRAWTPVLRQRIGRVLGRSAHGRSLSFSVDDVAQQVMAVLFAEHGKVLRSWDPARGLSLVHFVGLVAERQALVTVRTKRSNPFQDAPMDSEVLEQYTPASSSPEDQVEARDMFLEIAARMRVELSPYGIQMFELLFVQDKSVEEVSAELSMNADAVYAWRSRLVRQARTHASEILSEVSRSPQTIRRQG